MRTLLITILLIGTATANAQLYPAALVQRIKKDCTRLSDHFCKEEFNQKNDPLPPCSYQVSQKLVERLEDLRKICMNRPIIITSGFRSIEHNHDVGGVDHSQHLLGTAADIKVKDVSMDRLAQYARSVGFSFVKVYKDHVHVDVR